MFVCEWEWARNWGKKWVSMSIQRMHVRRAFVIVCVCAYVRVYYCGMCVFERDIKNIWWGDIELLATEMIRHLRCLWWKLWRSRTRSMETSRPSTLFFLCDCSRWLGRDEDKVSSLQCFDWWRHQYMMDVSSARLRHWAYINLLNPGICKYSFQTWATRRVEFHNTRHDNARFSGKQFQQSQLLVVLVRCERSKRRIALPWNSPRESPDRHADKYHTTWPNIRFSRVIRRLTVYFRRNVRIRSIDTLKGIGSVELLQKIFL